MTILCFITSRPSYSRIKTVLRGFEDIGLDYGVVCLASATESMFGNIADVVESDGYRVLRKLSTQLASNTGITATKTTALGLISAADIIEEIKPSAVISIADRFETIATAIAASYQNVPCIHIQGGECTGNIDDKVRDAVSALSDVHFPSSDCAAERLRRFVKNPDAIFNYGCPSVDLYVEAPELSRQQTLMRVIEKSVGSNMDFAKPFTVVMMHPDTHNIEGTEHFVKSLLIESLSPDNNLIWFWPNADPGSDVISKSIRVHREMHPSSNIRLVKNLDADLFINLLRHSRGLIGNSSVGVREVGVLGLPTVDIGGRQANREKHDNVVNLPYSAKGSQVMAALNVDRRSPSYTYGSGDAGRRIAERIAQLFGDSSRRLFRS
jgi:UDP-hydrolysing UDP-N-acetyl-D-glucosamine 2-epimerase